MWFAPLMKPSYPKNCQKQLLILLLAVLLFALPSAPAHAGGGISCYSKDGRAEISIALGRQPIYAPMNASARLDKKRWAGIPQDGETQLGDSQGLIEPNRFSADFVGDDILKIIISLRVDLSKEGSEDVAPGTLTFEDGIPHKVFCQFE